MTDTPAPTPAPAPAPTPAPSAHWYDGLPAEDIGYLQNRGLDKVDARAAFLEAMKAHKEAEKLIGAPAQELLRLPKDAKDAEGWQRFNERLGVPKEAKDYDFTGLKFKDGSEIDQASADAIRNALLTARVPKENAPIIAKAMIDLADGAEATDTAAYELKLNAEREALKVDWGANAPQNMMVVKQTVQTLGLDADVINALEKTAGYTKVFQALLKVGQAMGEDKFVQSQVPGQNTYMSKSQAQDTLNTKMADQSWANRLAAGDAIALKEFDTLTRVIQG